MKNFKVVKHYIDPKNYIYYVYQRNMFFFWEWLSSYSELSRAEFEIASLIEKIERDKVINAKTPKDKVMKYV